MSQIGSATGLNSSELAAWVQALGSIAAIIGSVGIAVWQSRQQHRASMSILQAERSFSRIEVAKALKELSIGAHRLLVHSMNAFPDRQAVSDVACGRTFYDIGELRVIEGAIQAIPVHALPHDLVRLTMIVGSCVRQFRENVEFAMQRHLEMDGKTFNVFFESLTSLSRSLDLTCKDIEAAIKLSDGEA